MANASLDQLLNKSLVSIWWDRVLNVIGDDPLILWVFGSTLVILLTYWSYAGLFSIIDMTNRPKWILKYKIQPKQNVPMDRAKYWKAIKQVIFNQTVVTPIALYVFYIAHVKNSPSSYNIRPLPSLFTYILHMILAILLEEILFYYVHRLLHHPSIYKYLHKKHHEWTSPIAAITFYCHPVEHILSNVGPIGFSLGLLNSHIIVAWSFSILAILNSMSDHTGYLFPFPFYKESILFHDLHHSKFNYNYGVLGWLDKLHGTYRAADVTKETK